MIIPSFANDGEEDEDDEDEDDDDEMIGQPGGATNNNLIGDLLQ